MHLPNAYRFAGVHSGLRPDPARLDLALIVSDVPASAAGVFTRNRVRAAPVRVSEARLPTDAARGVVICSGNANACTGQRGLDDARRMTAVTAEIIDCREEQVLVCSTGVIGRHLPMPVIESGIRKAALDLQPTPAALDAMAHAILTTDTRTKVTHRTMSLGGVEVRLTGVAKGAAMIGPNMATMLAFVFSDARVSSADLARLTKDAAARTFNCVSVEGHTSTNDTLLVFANGQAGGGRAQRLQGEGLTAYGNAVTDVCAELAKAIAADAEGATHFVTIDVEGLRSDAEARQVGMTVANSALVKTAIFGADPNWGRVVSAAGYAGVEFEEEQLSLWMGDTLLYEAGTPQPIDVKAASAHLKGTRNISLRLRFTLGSGSATVWTCDLTDEYVRLNADYTT
jgi:glutamate N-acetyltransferase / amino-acid N-acetyltransferase